MSGFIHTDGAEDLFNLLTGPMLGRGAYRIVYENHFNKKTVLKQDNGDNFSNIHEYTIWEEYKNTPLGKWLAPVIHCSPRGLWIVQMRTTPIRKGHFPKKVPDLFCDLKPSNWGMYQGRPVCHDYGNHELYKIARPAASKLMVVKPGVWE